MLFKIDQFFIHIGQTIEETDGDRKSRPECSPGFWADAEAKQMTVGGQENNGYF